MFNLVGCRTDHEYGYGGWTGVTTDKEEVVATFDLEKDAHEYIKKARLKNPKRLDHRPFRNKSLLTNYEYAEVVEEVKEPPPPHNPNPP